MYSSCYFYPGVCIKMSIYSIFRFHKHLSIVLHMHYYAIYIKRYLQMIGAALVMEYQQCLLNVMKIIE